MRPSILNPLFIPVTSLNGVGPRIGKQIEKLCGPTISDVLWHFPAAVNHRKVIESPEDVEVDAFGTIQVFVEKHYAPPRKIIPYRIKCIGIDRNIDLVFFNYHKSYLLQKFPEGTCLWVSGKIERNGAGFKILHPDYVGTNLNQIPEFEVIYPQTQGVSSKLLRKVIAPAVQNLPELPEWLDSAFQAKHHLPFWKNALEKVHSPKNLSDLLPTTPDRFRLAYDEILANQLALMLVRAKNKRESGQIIQGTGILNQAIRKNLPFQLTNAQERVLIEIQRDLESDFRMTRLLQGDVGSGKTIVALFSMLTAAEAGAQSALMAPTDILARQHFEKISKLCEPLGVKVGLLTAREKGKTRQKVLEDLVNGSIQILIGTHALLTETVQFAKLGLVVIDEQHKFGVHQRLSLVKKEKGVNLLVMTATPIPRSLALTAYGDMDVSCLNEKPLGRQPIETSVIPVERIPELIQKLKAKIKDKSTRTQAYWVCPLVEESGMPLTAVKKRYEELQKTFGERVGLVHGKMKGTEKDEVMDRFVKGELDVLVATTVIEVGVDVKSASIMIIEQAEHFGLAALHQLRGRVGRGSHRSQCVLLHGKPLTETAIKRLNVMRETDDGFIIAEEDLKLRGAGEVLGTRQSGMIEFKMASPVIQNELLWIATKDAQMILSLDPQLTSPRGQALRVLLYLFKKDLELQTLKAG